MFTSYIYSKPSIWYRRPFQEVRGYSAYQKDGKLFIKYNVLGLSKDDIKIEIEPSENSNFSYLIVKGEKQDGDLDTTWQVSYQTPVKTPENIEASVENGILTVSLQYKEPVKPDVKINWK